MDISHERLLSDIGSEHPEILELHDIKPPVSEEYLHGLCEGDEVLEELFDEMIEYFYRYTKDVCSQESLKQDSITDNIEEIREKEEPRRILHDSMIDSVRIFVRHLKEKGKDTTWFEDIDRKSRVGYAQLALLTTYLDIIRFNHGQ